MRTNNILVDYLLVILKKKKKKHSNTPCICKQYRNVNKTVTWWEDTIENQVCIFIK